MWEVKRYEIIETDKKEGMNIFERKSEAFSWILERLNARVDENLDCLEFLVGEINDQEEIVKYYVQKRNALIRQIEEEDIELANTIL